MKEKRHQVDVDNATIVPRSDYTRVLNAIVAKGFCPFCEEHLFKHHRKPIIFRSKYWLVTENSWPYQGSQHHFLFIARIHVEATEEVSAAVWANLKKVYRDVVKYYALKGATLMMRSGDTKFTGASVNHLHAHLVVGSSRTKKTKPIKAIVGFK